MILKCPNCNSEYAILETALGEAGRDVKCSKCAHKWFAMPDKGDETGALEEEIREEVTQEENEEQEENEDQSEDQSEDEEEIEDKENEELQQEEDEIDIPDSIKPSYTAPPLKANPLHAKMAGYGLALILFGFLVTYIFSNKNHIIATWSPSILFYELAGVPPQLKGEGLIIESLSATQLKDKEQRDILVLKGRVVNLTEDLINVPKMQAIMRTTNGEDGQRWIIDPPVESIKEGGSFAFTSNYPDVSGDVASVNLSFIPTLEE